jgi:hypothetical protein
LLGAYRLDYVTGLAIRKEVFLTPLIIEFEVFSIVYHYDEISCLLSLYSSLQLLERLLVSEEGLS